MKILFLYAFLFFTSCQVENKTNEEVLARVGDETLTRETLLLLAGGEASDAGVFSRLVDRWVENKLLYQAALSVGLDKDFALTKKRDLFYENLLISSFIQIQTKKRGVTTKKEVSDYYLKNKESFRRIDDEILVKHFTFPTERGAKKTKKELKKKKPRVDIESLLNRQQVVTKTIRKKDAGSSHLAFLFDGDVGNVLGPKKHDKNFHLFQILRKHKEGSYFGLEMVYDEIYQRLYKKKEASVFVFVLDSLYLNSDVFVSHKPMNK